MRILLLSFFLIATVALSNDAKKVKKYADYYADYYRLDRRLVYFVIEAESPWLHWGLDTLQYVAHEQKGDSNASLGPMQVKLKTAKKLWPNRKVTERMLLHDIEFNIATGCRLLVAEYEYFRARTKTIKGAWLLTLTAYNRGRTETIQTMKSNSYARSIYNKWKE
jgi:hypothetical protein